MKEVNSELKLLKCYQSEIDNEVSTVRWWLLNTAIYRLTAVPFHVIALISNHANNNPTIINIPSCLSKLNHVR